MSYHNLVLLHVVGWQAQQYIIGRGCNALRDSTVRCLGLAQLRGRV